MDNGCKKYGYILNKHQVGNYIIGASYRYTVSKLFPGESKETHRLIHSEVDKIEEGANYRLNSGVKVFIDNLAATSVKIGLVTGSWSAKIDNILKVNDLDLFSTVISRDDVKKGKPDPSPYQLAMKRLGVTSEQTLVFEDSDNGIISALNAGANCITVGNNFKGLMCINDFTEVQVSDNELIYQFSETNYGIKLRGNSGF